VTLVIEPQTRVSGAVGAFSGNDVMHVIRRPGRRLTPTRSTHGVSRQPLRTIRAPVIRPWQPHYAACPARPTSLARWGHQAAARVASARSSYFENPIQTKSFKMRRLKCYQASEHDPMVQVTNYG
jgi:hypothetical protein